MSLHTVPLNGASGITEQEAIFLAQMGRELGFEHLYQLYWHYVYLLCLRMVADPIEAEDLTQEAFLQVLCKIRTFRGESKFSTWLHRLTINVVLMRFRRLKHKELLLDDVSEKACKCTAAVAYLKDRGAEDLSLIGLIDRVNLARAIERLSSGYRQIFTLHDVQGYNHSEIAEILGCSVGNSKSQLHKARRVLRRMLRHGISDLEKARVMTHLESSVILVSSANAGFVEATPTHDAGTRWELSKVPL